MTDKPKKTRGRPQGTTKYPEKKDRKGIHLSLTPKALQWLKDNGGADVIEKLGWGFWRLDKGN